MAHANPLELEKPAQRPFSCAAENTTLDGNYQGLSSVYLHF